MQEIIVQFITLIREKFKDIKIKYDYDSEEDMHWLYHNNAELEYESSEFNEFVGKLIKDLIYDNKIFNFCFAYSYDYDLECKE